MDSLQEQECSSRVTQVMKSDTWKPSLLKKREEPTLQQVSGFNRPSYAIGKHEIIIFPDGSQLHAFSKLTCVMGM